MNEETRCGFVAIVGAPSVGKSTLLNRFLGEKISITAAKPQTTRHRILGVLTEPKGQLIFWDTPGLHLSERLLNLELIALAKSALADADVVLWVVDAVRRGVDHHLAQDLIRSVNQPLVVALNKVDKVAKDNRPRIELLAKSLDPGPRGAVFQISAKSGLGLFRLKNKLYDLLPSQNLLYPSDTLTDRPLRSLAAELIREEIFRLTNQEIPYSTAVTIEEFKEPHEKNDHYYLNATVHVEKPNQKKVIIGQGGQTIKLVGQGARRRLEELLDAKVFLNLFVRVTKNWTKNLKHIREFGYGG
ncbi:MAG: GTPase Era [Deltaproteobacteria bacterium]|jgi:GTP-binding protein Era|nr:GTPase Era [Deltaproteobacteria bacterium]